MTGPAVAAVFDVFFGMAFDTPGHSHRRDTGNPIHFLDGSMALLTLDVCLYVPLVREVNEIGDVVDLYPRDRFTILPVRRQLEDFRLLARIWQGPVASHTFTDTGHTGDRRPVCVNVAVPARNLVIRCMHGVTEFDWLDRRAVRIIFAVHPYAYQQSKHRHQPEQDRFLRGPERIENRDRQIVPPSFRPRVCPEDAQTTNSLLEPSSKCLRRGGDFGTFSRACYAHRCTLANHENTHSFGIIVANRLMCDARCTSGRRCRKGQSTLQHLYGLSRIER